MKLYKNNQTGEKYRAVKFYGHSGEIGEAMENVRLHGYRKISPNSQMKKGSYTEKSTGIFNVREEGKDTQVNWSDWVVIAENYDPIQVIPNDVFLANYTEEEPSA